MKYYKELKKIGIKPNQEQRSKDKNGTENEQRGPRWLKEVSVERLSVSSHGSSVSVSPANSVEDISSPKLLRHPCTPETSPQVTSTCSQQHTSPSESITPHPIQPTPISYISSIEIDGLLTLLRKVQEEDLFLTDCPLNLPDPLSLAALLVSQLKSSVIKTILPIKPTGVSLLQQNSQKCLKLETRKRKRQSLKVSIPGKYSRMEKSSKESACNDSVRVDSVTVTKSQDTCHECTSLKVNTRVPTSCPNECTCVSAESLINDECFVVEVQTESHTQHSESPYSHNPMITLASPIQSSELGDLPIDEDESITFSRSVSPCSPFTLCLPSTPSQPTPPS